MLALDHIVIAAKDPKRAADQFGKKHDVITIQGGTHEDWGTYNYLAYFSNHCYIEWLGIFDKQKAIHSDNPLVTQLTHILENHDEYAYQLAFRTNIMDEYVTLFQSSNIPFVGPIHGNRQKPDGSNLEWKMLFPITETDYLYPFLIEWGKTKNVPEDQRLINTKPIQSLTLKQDQNELKHFEHVYQIATSHPHIQLENVALLFADQMELLKFNV